MQYKSVESSNINKIGYDEKTNDLFIVFTNNTEYVYRNVSQKVYKQLMEAESHGKFLNSDIKGTYTYERVS